MAVSVLPACACAFGLLTLVGFIHEARCSCTASVPVYEQTSPLNLMLPRVGQYADGEELGSAEELLHRIFTTVYMGTANSSPETRQRAATLAEQVSTCSPAVHL